MRGKAVLRTTFSHTHRITPAYAGKSLSFLSRSAILQDHPRLCGEKGVMIDEPRTIIGSPPPMRGKVLNHKTLTLACGITPAYAGKSTSVLLQSGYLQDHPRLCGEKYCRIPQQQQDIGSPPPMRGKAIKIPSGLSVMRDHPRLCGEKFRIFCVKLFNKGSPPPMRGKESACTPQSYQARITPAYAGKSCSSNHVFTQA